VLTARGPPDMRGMGHCQLPRQLRKLDPDVPSIFIAIPPDLREIPPAGSGAQPNG